LIEREPGLDEDPATTHHLDGRIFCITGMAVKMKYRKRGYGLVILDKLIEIAHREGCRKILLETTHAQGLYLKRGFTTVQNRAERGISLDVMSLEIESYGSKA
jgi:N-acetylglutamate synthase-like GNAT family acetyltransferase